jgi:predicted dehydrogenase
MTKVRVGIIGGGPSSAVGTAHLAALHLDGLFDIVAVVPSGNPEKSPGEAVSARGIQQWNRRIDGKAHRYPSAHSMLQDLGADLDFVIVLTPTPDHVTSVTLALEHGLNVIVEKPLATSVEDAQKLTSLAKTKGKKLIVVNNYAGYPSLIGFRKIVETGGLGDLVSFDGRMLQDTFVRKTNGEPEKIQPWRTNDYEIPTVSLDLGIHIMHLTNFVTGALPDNVDMVQRAAGYPPNVVSGVSLVGNFASGTGFTGEFGKDFLGRRNAMSLSAYGMNGSLTWSHSKPDELVFADQSSRNSTLDMFDLKKMVAGLVDLERFKPGHPVGFVEALANFYLAVHMDFFGEQHIATSILVDAQVSVSCLALLTPPPKPPSLFS